ncbi:hypothetical protein BKA66DRAFT_541509 [Pyrenochaeta sp. MPI-SDFR-AT-0127]|nr:hypothetical protein BKA66DRAFT_541509 [Pyrenochaeta sp. MPI-SDFR-AT-0127]
MSGSNRQRQHYRQRAGGASKTAWMLKDAGELIQMLTSTSLEPDSTAVSSELVFETLCSYNWQDDGTAILVPGGPPRWEPPPLPVTLSPDSGLNCKNQGISRVPKYPFEPAFQAMSIMNPNLQLDGVDIIANRNSLRKLFDFVAGKRQEPFCMGLCMVKNTLFISRKEKTARMMIHGYANSGYGHNFEEAFSTPEPGLAGSGSHHRVIRYDLGHLNCVVRFEVDAYHTDSDDTAQHLVDDLTTTISQLTVNELPMSSTTQPSTNVIQRGTFIQASKLAEMKVRKAERINDAMPQLWFGRTPYLLVGKHVEGVVHSTTCSHVERQFEAWETNNQGNLRKLVTLLAELKLMVRGVEGRAAVLVCAEKGAPLQILRTKNKTDVLPRKIVENHWSREGDGD